METITSTRVASLGPWALCLALCGAGCTTENELYCNDDKGKHCPEGKRCDPSTNLCVPLPDSGARIDGAADRGPAGDAAPADGEVVGDVGEQLLELGQACGNAGQCGSGFCVDAVCCAAACAGACRSCSLPGKQGSCELQLEGQDPRGDCREASDQPGSCDGVCDGAGACRYPDQSLACGAPSCSAGELTTERCDGAGGCSAKVTSCGGYACAAAGDACRSACTDAAIHCTGDFVCVGGACKNPQPDGATCGTNDDACASVHCVDGVCCAAASCPVCNACDLDGKGTCSPVADGPSCGAVSCTVAELSTPTCQGGACVPVKQSCSPYKCNPGGTGCRTACDEHSDCVSGYFCNPSKQCEALRANGEPCEEYLWCASGQCSDDVCCDTACSEECDSCKLPGKVGSCSPVAKGTDCGPADHCVNSSSAASLIEQWSCDGVNLACQMSELSCGAYKCDGNTDVCYDSCTLSDYCVYGSVCDHSQLHVDGTGICAPLDKVVAVGTTLQATIDAIPPGARHYVRLVQPSYLEGLVVSGKSVALFSNYPGGTQLKSAPGVGLTIGAGGEVLLQDIVVSNAAHVGIKCAGSAGSQGKLILVDSVVDGSGLEGVLAEDCQVTIRRSTITNNDGGGVLIGSNAGQAVLVNSDISHNGNTSSDLGGVLITSAGATFWNNNVVGNEAGGSSGDAVLCTASTELHNSIFWGYADAPLQGCTAHYSIIQHLLAMPGTTTNLAVDPLLVGSVIGSTSPAIDKGQANPHTVVDRLRNPRPLGGAVDIGAHELR